MCGTFGVGAAKGGFENGEEGRGGFDGEFFVIVGVGHDYLQCIAFYTASRKTDHTVVIGNLFLSWRRNPASSVRLPLNLGGSGIFSDFSVPFAAKGGEGGGGGGLGGSPSSSSGVGSWDSGSCILSCKVQCSSRIRARV